MSELFCEGEDFPKFSKNPVEVENQDLWFINRELERYHLSLGVLEDNPFIADRWILSLFAFSYARKKIFNIDDTEFIRAKIKELPLKIKVPWVIHLRYQGDIVERILSRKQDIYKKNERSLREPYNREFYSCQQGYYNQLVKIMGTSAIVINPDNKTHDNIELVYSWVSAKKTTWPDIPLESLIF